MEVLQYIFTALGGAAVAGVPLYASIRKIRSDMAKDKQEREAQQAAIEAKAAADRQALEAKAAQDKQALDAKQAELDAKKRIDTEAEWKRIIEFRDAEVTRLRDRDNTQEKQIQDIYNRLIESQKQEARKDEKLKGLEDRVERLTQMLLSRCPDCPLIRTQAKIELPTVPQ